LGRLLHGKFFFFQADWQFAICTAQFQLTSRLSIYITIVVGNLWQGRQVHNHCNLGFAEFSWQQQFFCWEANWGCPWCARMRYRMSMTAG
jgi:hypothetical protein